MMSAKANKHRANLPSCVFKADAGDSSRLDRRKTSAMPAAESQSTVRNARRNQKKINESKPTPALMIVDQYSHGLERNSGASRLIRENPVVSGGPSALTSLSHMPLLPAAE